MFFFSNLSKNYQRESEYIQRVSMSHLAAFGPISTPLACVAVPFLSLGTFVTKWHAKQVKLWNFIFSTFFINSCISKATYQYTIPKGTFWGAKHQNKDFRRKIQFCLFPRAKVSLQTQMTISQPRNNFLKYFKSL